MVVRRLARGLAVAVVAALPFLGGAVSVSAANFPLWDVASGCVHVAPSNTNFICNSGGTLSTTLFEQYQYEQVLVAISQYGPDGTPGMDVQISGASFDLYDGLIPSGFGGFTAFNVGPLTPGEELAITMSAQDKGAFIVGVSVSPGVAPAATATPNPSFTATPTLGANTPFPTNTPRPTVAVGTFSATPSPTPSPSRTPVATATAGVLLRDCGTAGFPLLNCDFTDGSTDGTSVVASHWTRDGAESAYCYPAPPSGLPEIRMDGTLAGGSFDYVCKQTVTPGATGDLWIQYQISALTVGGFFAVGVFSTVGSFDTAVDLSSCPYGSGTFCYLSVGSVAVGVPAAFSWAAHGPGAESAHVYYNVWVQPSGTSTPATPVPSVTVTGTVTPVPSSTALPSATGTAISAPCDPAIFGSAACGGQNSAAGGCSLFDFKCWFEPQCLACDASPLVHAVGTEVPVPASTFAGLGSLVNSSVACAPFGGSNVPIEGQVEHPSVVFLSVSFAPCAHPSIFPSGLFGAIRNLSGVVIAVAMFMYCLRFVQRVFGRRGLTGGSP